MEDKQAQAPKKRRPDGRTVASGVLAVGLCLSLGANAAQAVRSRDLETRLSMERQRDMTDVVSAMADIEVNLQKLLIASGASQSVALLGKTALLAQHVETGLSRLPLSEQTAAGAMKFAGQMGDYVMTLASRVSSGGMLTTDDEQRIEELLSACQGLNAHLLGAYDQLYAEPITVTDAAGGWPEAALAGDSGIEVPSLIYDGPFSDGRTNGAPRGLTGERVTREQAREAAARFAGVTADRVTDAADSGGSFEAFGFTADTPDGRLSVQVTGQGGHLLWMMPEQAAYEARLSQEECLTRAKAWLSQAGFGEMERCFVQQYDGMVVANFAGVQDGVLIYPDQVKVQVSMQSGAVVGAECSQYLMNHAARGDLTPKLAAARAQQALSPRLQVQKSRPCVIPTDSGERLCWEFEGTFSGADYYAYVDANTGEPAQILRVEQTQDGQTAL
ncbi:MAG: PepSY1/2 domain-containing protein [Candidatus Ventricola sp.]